MIKSLDGLLNSIKFLSATSAKALAYPILGTLPNQEYLDDRIEWYDSRIGTRLGSYLEIFGGAIYFALSNQPAPGIACAADGVLRIMLNDEGAKPRGSLLFEIPYALFKGANVLAKTSKTMLREYLTKYFEMYGEPFFIKK